MQFFTVELFRGDKIESS